MLKKNSPIATNYGEQCAALLGEFPLVADVKIVVGFWNRWTRMHALAIKSFENETSPTNSIDFETIGSELMKLRLRTVSGLVQGLKTISNNSELNNSIRALMSAHDLIFLHCLETHRESLKSDLSVAKTAHRALGAYAQSARQIGDTRLW
jgi:hypothetical protein